MLALCKVVMLDLSGCTGFVVGGAGGIEESGTRHLPKTGDDYGEYACAYRGWFSGLIQKRGIKRAVYEAPILDKKNGIIAIRKMNALCVMTEVVCRDLGVECFEVPLSSIRSFFIGTSRAPASIGQHETPERAKAVRREWIKQRVSYECRQRGHSPGDDNEADAIAMFYFYQKLTDPLSKANMAMLIGAGEDVEDEFA